MAFTDDPSSPRPTRARLAVGLFALLGFLTSVTVHLLTFVPGLAVTMHSPVVLLHVAMFPPFFALVLALRAEMKGVPSREAKRHLLNVLPRWGKVLVLVTFYYAVVNFGLFMLRTDGAATQRADGSFVISSHGRVVRQISREEAVENEARTARGFSGHWMVFYLLPAMYFLARRPDGERPNGLVS
jgi:hypothetical protein